MPADQLCSRIEITIFRSLSIKNLLSKNLPSVYNVKLPRHLLFHPGWIQMVSKVRRSTLSSLTFHYSAQKTFYTELPSALGFLGGTRGKEPPCQWRRCQRQGFDTWVRRSSGGGHGSNILAWRIPWIEEPGQAMVHSIVIWI